MDTSEEGRLTLKDATDVSLVKGYEEGTDLLIFNLEGQWYHVESTSEERCHKLAEDVIAYLDALWLDFETPSPYAWWWSFDAWGSEVLVILDATIADANPCRYDASKHKLLCTLRLADTYPYVSSEVEVQHPAAQRCTRPARPSPRREGRQISQESEQ